jgi:hypothetical protein
MKACDLEMEGDLKPIRAELRSCVRLGRWSVLYLIERREEAEERLKEGKRTNRPIRAQGQTISAFSSYLGDDYKTRRFTEEWVYGPIQEVVSIPPLSQ